jgi:hypothetical protein
MKKLRSFASDIRNAAIGPAASGDACFGAAF